MVNGASLNGRTKRRGIPLGAMRYPEFRKYWFATLASVIGFQMVMFSQLWLVRQLEESPLWLGAVGMANGVPSIVLTLFGGVLADRIPQKRLIMLTQTLMGSLVLLLAVLTMLGVVEVWHVLAIGFVSGAVNAFDAPARQAIFPNLIERKEMVSAVALNSSIWQGTRMVAPMFSGIIIAAFGTSTSLFIGAAGFLSMAVLISRLNVPLVTRTRRNSAVHDLVEGARYVRDNVLFSSLIGMTFFNSFFGMAYLQLMPIFTIDVLKKSAAAQGALMSAGGVGALLGTAVVALLGRVRRRGLLIVFGSACFGMLIVGFGLSHWYLLSIAFLFLSGFFQSVYMISIMSTLQMKVPDDLRGRVMGIYGMTYNLMPLGGMLAGGVASALSAPFAVAVGGGAVTGFALFNGAFHRTVRGLRAEMSQDGGREAAAGAARR
ncbi:MAG: MFS transporter [SAR202 cluster bacterium]|nr:MFS transporter [SAR202 cluster bacterium]